MPTKTNHYWLAPVVNLYDEVGKALAKRLSRPRSMSKAIITLLVRTERFGETYYT